MLLKKLIARHAHRGLLAFLDPAGVLEEGEVTFAKQRYLAFRSDSALEIRRFLEGLEKDVRPVLLLNRKVPGLEDWTEAIISLDPREVLEMLWGEAPPPEAPIVPEALHLLARKPDPLPQTGEELARLVLERALGRSVQKARDLLLDIAPEFRLYRDLLLKAESPLLADLARAKDEDPGVLEALYWKALLEEHGLELALQDLHPSGAILEQHVPAGARELWAQLGLRPPATSKVLAKLGPYLNPPWEALSRENLDPSLAQGLALKTVEAVLDRPEVAPDPSLAQNPLPDEEVRNLLEATLRLAVWWKETETPDPDTPDAFAKAWSDAAILLDRLRILARKHLPDQSALHKFSERIQQRLDALNRAWFQLIKKEYAAWLSRSPGNRPLLVADVLNLLRRRYRAPLYLIVFDGLRWDFWHHAFRKWLKDILEEKEYALIEETVGVSILPSATQFARKALFSGKMPAERNGNNELKLLAEALDRMGLASAKTILASGFQARAELDYDAAKEILDSPLPVKPLVFNIADQTLEESADDLYTALGVLKTRFDNQVRPLLQRLDSGGLVLVASDHGLIHLNEAMEAFEGGREEGDWNYRYAQLFEEVPELSDPDWQTHLLTPSEGHLFKFNKHFQREVRAWAFPGPETYFLRKGGRPGSGYRHGGISLEEMLIPVALFAPQEKSRGARVDLELSPLQMKQGVPTELTLQLKNSSLTPAQDLRVRWDEEERQLERLDPGNVWKWSRTIRLEAPTSSLVEVRWKDPNGNEQRCTEPFMLKVETVVERPSGLLDELFGGEG